MLAITVDIEDWYHIPSVTGSPFSKYRDVDEFFSKWEGRYDYLTVPTLRVLDLLDEFKIRVTFFVVADVIEHYPGLVEKIASKGHEIACHGLHHMCKINTKTKQPMMSQSEFEEKTRRAKSMLESASGQKIVGYRAPNAYIAGWMLDSLEKLGFRYDSSVAVNSFYNKSDSKLKGVDTRPYYPGRGSLDQGNEKRGILELPWPYFKAGPGFPTGGGPLLRFFGARYIMLGLTQSMKRGDTLFYFHPIDISDDAFPSGFSAKRPFYWAVKGNKVENDIRKMLDRNAEVTCTCAEVIARYGQDN